MIDKFGPSNLAKTQDDFDAATQAAYLGADNNLAQWVNGVDSGKSLADDPAAVTAADPVTYVDRRDPPFLLMHGDDDRAVSPSQTLLVHTALRAAGVESTRYVLRGAGHGDLGLPTGSDLSPWTSTQITGYMVDFLNAHLNSSPGH